MRGVLLPVGLFFLSPLVAEFLLGNLPITALPALLLLAPLYGGGALLIREVVRRTRRGWPTIVVLALAYGVLEEGLTTMSLFNPNYAGLRLLDNGYLPALGIGLPWTLFVLGLHTIWSISTPILLMEVLAGERRTTPWLGRLGLALVGVLFAIGVVGSTLLSINTSGGFVATVPQLVATVAVVVLLVGLAFALGRLPSRVPRAMPPGAPAPWLVGLAALLATSAFKALPLAAPAWLYVGAVLLLAAVAVAAVWYCSGLLGWGDGQRLALAAGALATYAWSAFPERPVLPAAEVVDLIGNVVFALGAAALVAAAARGVTLSNRKLAP